MSEPVEELGPCADRVALCGEDSCEYAGSSFVCSNCGDIVCWCDGGPPSEADPEGTRCSMCWCGADARMQRGVGA